MFVSVQCTALPGLRTAWKETGMLKTILVILVALWLLGFILHVEGSLIHLLLGISLVVLLVDLISGRRHVL
jgi:diacylglycerol kinase